MSKTNYSLIWFDFDSNRGG